MEGSHTSLIFCPLSYCAGVLDNNGRMRLRTQNGEAYSASIELTAKCRSVAVLTKHLGGKVTKCDGNTCTWVVPAWQQYRVAGALLPYLQVIDRREALSKILRFRVTQPRKQFGKPVPKSIRTYRKRLARGGIRDGEVSKNEGDTTSSYDS